MFLNWKDAEIYNKWVSYLFKISINKGKEKFYALLKKKYKAFNLE